ncbi:MAG: AMP-binding protein, partial [Polymorphobacter sp.]
MTASWPAMSIAEAHALLTAPGAPLEMETVVIRGLPTRTWKNLPPTLRDVFLAGRAHGEKIFLVHEDERVSFEAFARAVLCLAARLQADGLVKGDRVAVVMRNIPEWPVAFFAASLCGAIVTPLNAWWTGGELEYGLSDSGAKLLLVDAERLARLTEHLPNCPALEHIYVTRTGDDFGPEAGNPLMCRLDSIIGTPDSWASLPAGQIPAVDLGPEDDATIFYTSGTTGKPKGALGTHRNICSNIMASASAAARSYLRRGETPPVPDPGAPQKGTLLSVPFFHATGCHAVLSPSLFAGAKLVMMRKWDVPRAMELIERERLTGAGGVPTIAWQIIEHPDRPKYDLSSLEGISYGGAPSAPELVRQIKANWPKALPGNGWGMTETSATFTQHQAEDYENRPDSCGPAVPVCDLKITDPDGNILGPNSVGEIWGFGPNIVKGYWNKPEASAATFVDGWVRTGD